MNTVSGSSSFSTSAATSHGMSGLASGLDTEGMVESMLTGTQNKIDKANAEKQQITWKQEIYRDLISDINSFQNIFFGKTSSSNLLSSDFYNAMTAISSSKAFSATASTNAATGNTNVSVGQLATSAKIQSGTAVSGTLTGKLDASVFSRKVVFNDGTTDIEIDLQSAYDAIAADKSLTDSQQMDKLVGELNAAAGPLDGTGISASLDDKGRLVLQKDGANLTVSAKSSKLGLKTLGLAAGQKSSDEGAFTSIADPDAAVNFTLDLNGITRTITLDGTSLNKDSDSDAIKTALEEKINAAFGSGWVKITAAADGTLTLSANGKGNVITVAGDTTGLSLLGVVSGSSDKISRGQMLKDVNFSTGLQGSAFAFTINDVDFSFTGEQTLNDVIKAVNNSSAGVRITYSEIEDRFTIESSSTGAGFQIRMSQTEGNLLNAMFGSGMDGNLATGSAVSSSELLTDSIKAGDCVGNQFTYGYFSFKADGNSYSIYLKKKENGSNYTREELYYAINEGLAAKLGYVEGTDDDGNAITQQAVELEWNAAGDYSLAVRNGMKISFNDATAKISGYDTMSPEDQKKALAEAAKSNYELAFGLSGMNNVLADDADLDATTLASVGLEDMTINGTAVTTVQGLLDAYNQPGSDLVATFENGKIKLSLAAGTTQKDVTLPAELAGLFGSGTLNMGKVPAGAAQATGIDGQNAIVSVNGVTLERSSNTFTVNGLTLTLNATTGALMNSLTKVEDTTVQWTNAATGDVYTAGANGQILDSSGNVVSAKKYDAAGDLWKSYANFTQVAGDTWKDIGGTEYTIKDGKIYDKGTNNLATGLETMIIDDSGRVWEKDTLTKTSTTAVQWKDSSGTLYELGGADGKTIVDAATGQAASAFAGMTVGADGKLLTKDTGEAASLILGEAGTVTTSRNTDQILEGMKSFVEKYNTMIGKLNGLVDEESTYKDYPPLTSAQKKEMSENEITLWEEKAKEGLLRRDSNIESFLSSMRTLLYSKPDGSDYSLYDVGIETSNEWKDKGKLVIDEAKLRTIIESNPQALQSLFVGEGGDGLASRLNEAINRTANTSSGSPGTLVALAGVEGKASSITNTLTKRLRELNSKISDLQKKYETEKARYWKQFNAMESALSSLNSQSNWLSQQFA